jgi:hypothetical protein
MYEVDDPRSRLATAGAAGGAKTGSAFGDSTYARFYDEAPREQDSTQRTWYVRGQNFIVAYSIVRECTTFERNAQIDEYVLLLPETGVFARIETDDERVDVAGYSVTMVPAGSSKLTICGSGPAIRLFSTQSEDLCRLVSNPEKYASPHPQVPPFEPWPEPADGRRIRSYSLDVADEPGRFGKIFRCTTFMVNVFPPLHGPRDPAKLSPHHHDDFEQCSLATGGVYEHHLRWPWTADKTEWREDQHERCGSPSVCVIPPRVIHTSAAVHPEVNLLVDIFAPPRADFSDMPGWVLNADDYPRP